MTPLESVTDIEFAAYALDILRRELGLSGYAHFLRVYRAGTGDYTINRQTWLEGRSVNELAISKS
jgi:hypothetical protein